MKKDTGSGITSSILKTTEKYSRKMTTITTGALNRNAKTSEIHQHIEKSLQQSIANQQAADINTMSSGFNTVQAESENTIAQNYNFDLTENAL
ncbi:unnamed protein product, partial [Rotaria sp. Silwood2]